jgi:hypothetical protein
VVSLVSVVLSGFASRLAAELTCNFIRLSVNSPSYGHSHVHNYQLREPKLHPSRITDSSHRCWLNEPAGTLNTMSNFKRAVVPQGNNKSAVLNSLKATTMVDSKPVLPAGSYASEIFQRTALIRGYRNHFHNSGLPSRARSFPLCSDI